MQMTQESSDPDLNLQLLNDHGIYTVEEINGLSRTVKPQYSVIHLNTRSLKQHFEQMHVQSSSDVPFIESPRLLFVEQTRKNHHKIVWIAEIAASQIVEDHKGNAFIVEKMIKKIVMLFTIIIVT